MTKALVTGGSGFLGRHLVRELANRKIQTVVVDQTPFNAGLCPPASRHYIQPVAGDIRDSRILIKAMKGCDLVFHTAAIAEIDDARKDPVRTMEVNVMGTVNCLEAARKNGVGRFLFASSVYTAGNWGSFYRVSKQAGESLCKSYSEDFGLNYTVLRYGSLYGRDANEWNFIRSVCQSLLETGEYTYTSSPDAIREYIHIFDAARETIRISTDPDFINKAVLITGHQRMKVSDLFTMIQEIMGKKIHINYEPVDQQRHYIITPYSFEVDIPVRINLPTYVDISEGILDCLRDTQHDIDAGHTNALKKKSGTRRRKNGG